MIKIYGYKKCSTVNKALKFLDNNNLKYEYFDNVVTPLSVSELKDIYSKSQLDIKKLFNTSGIRYRKLKLKDKLENMSIDEKLKLLSSDGMLVKRPILMMEDIVLIGFDIKKWEIIL